jgi:hypothetical protein
MCIEVMHFFNGMIFESEAALLGPTRWGPRATAARIPIPNYIYKTCPILAYAYLVGPPRGGGIGCEDETARATSGQTSRTADWIGRLGK